MNKICIIIRSVFIQFKKVFCKLLYGRHTSLKFNTANPFTFVIINDQVKLSRDTFVLLGYLGFNFLWKNISLICWSLNRIIVWPVLLLTYFIELLNKCKSKFLLTYPSLSLALHIIFMLKAVSREHKTWFLAWMEANIFSIIWKNNINDFESLI